MAALQGLLASSRGRSTLFGAVQYSALLASGLVATSDGEEVSFRNTVCTSLRNLYRALSDCRMLLRFGDSLALILPQQDAPSECQEHWMIKAIDFVSDLANRLYYPVEHVAWGIDKKIIAYGTSTKWWDGTAYVSLVSVLCAMVKTITTWVAIVKLKQEVAASKPAGGDVSRRKLRRRECLVLMDFFKNVASFVMVVHYLPSGLLWGKRLGSTFLGLLGVFSSSITLWKMIYC
eukprot:m.8213 g.8213  ORF g.8213 m.8213 type:complete len:233 (+) comp20423_c0_seq2:22-720(+)